jgi:steroid delta-isomerase-like uncharacterized protein
MSRNVEVFRAAHAAFNRRDFDAVLRVMADDCVYEDHALGTTFTGPAGFKKFLQGWVAAFSNAEVAEAGYIDAGDVVIAEFRGRGTNDGPLGPMPASGGRIDLPFCEIMRFDAQGRVVAGGIYYDQMTLLRQLGHAPAAAAGS